jgi:cytochrome c oxidase cbb3-type subunit II
MCAYRMSDRCSFLAVYDERGIIYNHYNPPAAGASANARIRGPVIEWLNDKQKAHFLRLRMVTEIGAEPVPAQAPAAVDLDPVDLDPVDLDPVDLDSEPEPEPVLREDEPSEVLDELVEECIKSLDRLGVQRDAGAPNARKALRDSGQHYANAVVCAAVRARKASLAGVAP